MDSQQVFERDLPRFAGQLDSGLHGGDVAEDLDCDTVGCFATLGEECFGFDEAAGPASRPSIFEEATDSALRRKRASPSRLT